MVGSSSVAFGDLLAPKRVKTFELETGLKEAVRLNPAADILFTLDDLANKDASIWDVPTVFVAGVPYISGGVYKSGTKILRTWKKAPNKVAGQLDEAFHYTARQWGDVIKRQGLRPGSYGTPNGNLSGLGAKLELSLPPTRSAPDIRIRIDLDGLRKAGYEIPTPKRVSNVVTGPDGQPSW